MTLLAMFGEWYDNKVICLLIFVKGLMLGFEMSENRDPTRPLAAAQVNKIWNECKDEGVLFGKGGAYGQTFRYFEAYVELL